MFPVYSPEKYQSNSHPQPQQPEAEPDVQLSESVKRMFQHFKLTGQFSTTYPLGGNPDQNLDEDYLSPYERDLVFSKITQLDEEHAMRNSDVLIAARQSIRMADPTFQDQEAEQLGVEQIVHQQGQPKNQQDNHATTSHQPHQDDPNDLPDHSPEDIEKLYYMQTAAKDQQQLASSPSQQVSGSTKVQFTGSMFHTSEGWRKLVMFENFIKEIIFEMGIMNRLYDDFATFLEIAQQNYQKMKELKQQQHEIQQLEQQRQPEKPSCQQTTAEQSKPSSASHQYFEATVMNSGRKSQQGQNRTSIQKSSSIRGNSPSASNFPSSTQCSQQNRTSIEIKTKGMSNSSHATALPATTPPSSQDMPIEPPPSLPSKKSILKRKASVDKKRVTLVLSENSPEQIAEMKAALANALAHHIRILTQGKTFKKYCYNKCKEELVHAYFSTDFKCFCWKPVEKDEAKLEPMNELIQVLQGRRSRNFKKYLKKNEDQEDGLSFSMVFKSRTVDLSAETPDERHEFLTAMKELKKFL